jgi:hypothetical protein
MHKKTLEAKKIKNCYTAQKSCVMKGNKRVLNLFKTFINRKRPES